VPADESPDHVPLLDRIRAEIRDRGPISFAHFMELALYDPRDGYYARGAERLGPGGDFITASDAGRAFGRCVARQIVEIDRRIGPCDPFDVIEFGAGRGLLALDVLDAMSELDAALAARLRYLMVDRSERMRSQAARRVPAARVLSPDELQPGSRGCVLAVELFDALPVHRLRRSGEGLFEVHVDLDDAGELTEVERPPTDAVRQMAERYAAAAVVGTEAELTPLVCAQLDAMERILDQGVMIIVDYGHPAAELYRPERRRGTLLAYHGHTTNEAFLERVGEQDLTAHVNFTALEDRARERGLAVLGRTTQDRFLIGNGILEVFEPADGRERPDARQVKDRLRAMQLIHPAGMGRTFKVLALSKGCDPPPQLSGLHDPFTRGYRCGDRRPD
jgi:SAM-dependent MidA family methyltransferase